MFDPMTFWMQSSLVWFRMFQQQQEFYLQLAGRMAQNMPRECAADLAREAEAMKHALKPDERRRPRKPATKPASRKPELATA